MYDESVRVRVRMSEGTKKLFRKIMNLYPKALSVMNNDEELFVLVLNTMQAQFKDREKYEEFIATKNKSIGVLRRIEKVILDEW